MFQPFCKLSGRLVFEDLLKYPEFQPNSGILISLSELLGLFYYYFLFRFYFIFLLLIFFIYYYFLFFYCYFVVYSGDGCDGDGILVFQLVCMFSK